MERLKFLVALLLSVFLWQTAYAEAQTGSTTVGDKTVNYSYEFTEADGNVKFSITITSIKDGSGNDANIDGLVTPTFYDGSGAQLQGGGGAITLGTPNTYTWTTTPTSGTVLTIRANYAYSGNSFNLPGDNQTFSHTVGSSGENTPPATSTITNLALNKTTKATTETKSAGNAVDGNSTGDSRWESAVSDPQTWQVDLGSSQTFNAIVIYWEAAYGKTFTIEAGDNVDGDGYLTGGTTIASVTGQSLSGFPYKQVIPVSSTTARYIKFNGIERGTPYGYSFWEFEVYNDASLATNSISITSANTATGAVSKYVGETEQFTYTATNASSAAVTPGIITWESSNTAVGTIDANGLFTAVAPGTTNITLTSGGVVSNSITVTVNIPTPTTVPTDVPAIITSFNDGTNNYTIESDQVTKIYTVDGNAANFGFQVYNSTAMEAVTINGKQAEKLTNFNTLVGAFTEQNISDANYLHVDVYPMEAFNLTVYHSQSNQKGKKYTDLIPGQWNSIDIPMSYFSSPTATNTFLLTQNMTDDGKESRDGDIANVTLYLGNYYYFRTATVPDNEKPVMQSATTSNIGNTTATLTVQATDNKAGTLTYNIYKGSVVEANKLATTTGTAGQNTVVNLTELTQNGTYNLVVTATDAAGNTSDAFAVAEFTTLDYVPTLTTIQVIMKGESTDGFNTSNTGDFQRTLRVIALDQKGLDMPTREMTLRITDGNTGTNDVSFVNTTVNTVSKDGTDGSTAIQVNNHVGRVTVEAVDNTTGKTGYGFLTFYQPSDLISDPQKVSSAKIFGVGDDGIIKLAADGHGTKTYTTDDGKSAEFVVTWSTETDGSQHYEYYDIDMIQLLYQEGNFPSDYTISVSRDQGATWEDVYRYDKSKPVYIDPNNAKYRAEVWNESRQNTQAVSQIRFRSNNTDKITFDAFKVYGKLNSSTDNKAPYDLYAGVVDNPVNSVSTDQDTKTSTAKIWLECKDDETAESDYLYYTLTSSTGMQYTTKGHPRKGTNLNQVEFDFNNTLVPGTHYVFYVTASDGRNKTNLEGNSNELMIVEFDTPALEEAPVVTGEAINVEATTATLNYWLPETSNTGIADDATIVFTVKYGTNVINDISKKKSECTGDGKKLSLALTKLVPNTHYTYTITATNTANGLSSEKAVTFTTKVGGGQLKIWFAEADENKEGSYWVGRTGDLQKLITDAAYANKKLQDVTELHIEGPLNSEDVIVLRRMAAASPYIGNDKVKTRVFVKADKAPYIYAWKEDGTKLCGDFPGEVMLERFDDYWEYEFKETGVKFVISNGTTEGLGNGNNQSGNQEAAEGENYYTYNGGKELTAVTNQYGQLATLDLKKASFYHDGGTYVIRWYADANTSTRLDLDGGEYVTKGDIEGYMFYDCRTLKNVTLPESCKIVGNSAFHAGKHDDGISLETLTMFNDIEKIDAYAFEMNENLGQVTLPEKLNFIGYNAFCDSHAMTLSDAQLPNTITFIDNQAFSNTSIAAVKLPVNPSYTTVNTNVFGWSRELTSVDIPANVTTLMNGSFRDSKKLVTITGADNITEIGDEAFLNDEVLPSEVVNKLISKLTVLNNGVFNGCKAVTNVVIPASVTTLKNLTFANCTGLRKVTVNSAKAPTDYTVTSGEMKDSEGHITDPFAAVVANTMTLDFQNGAASVDGYKTYRDGTVQSNPFRRLLTKTLDETATKYDVAGQMHADVVLKRTMVEGWNTVALPFGVKSGDGDARDRGGITAAGVYQKAFNGENYDRFMIAAYRGIDTSNAEDHVFKFLKYADYTTDPLDEFEPLLIRMGKDNLSANNEYTFTDVDLNYDAEEGKLYREGNKEEDVPVKKFVPATTEGKEGTWEGFVGNYNRNDMKQFKDCKDDFAFTGTYSTKTTLDIKNESGGIVYGSTAYAYTGLGSDGLGSDYFLNEGDYIIQDNLFYKVVKTNNYGLRGYRAWFKQQPTTPTETRSSKLMFQVVEMAQPEVPTEIESLDSIDSDVEPFDVYSLGGQMLRKQTKSLSGLPNGIYIVNGRKVAVGR